MPSGPSDITQPQNAFDEGELSRRSAPYPRLYRTERKEGN